MSNEGSPNGRRLKIDGTPLLEETLGALRASARYVVHEGGTRSSKTHSIIQALIILALRKKLEIHVCRKAMPVLRRSAMKHWQEQLEALGLYDEARHEKTNSIYHLGRSEIAFFGTDEESKLRGPERDILWVNEANEISKGEWLELRRRTRRVILLDYNPSHGATHWIDEEVIDSGRAEVIHSTYRDNKFLPAAQITDIEQDVPRYREPDGTVITDWQLEYEGDGVLIKGSPAAWAVHGLGKRAKSERIIYPHWSLIDRMPAALDDECYGLDFGYSHPTALVHVGWKDVVGEDVNLIWDEVLCEAGLTNSDLAGRLGELGIPQDVPIYADAAEPQRIEELCEAGWNVKPAEKSVTDGILSVKEHRLRLTRRSVTLQKEIEGYRYRTDKDGNILEVPVKKDDHLLDGGRYGTHTHLLVPELDYGRP